MRHLALIALAVLWIAPAQAETKNAPDGFGPVKFGMTREEVWEAIGGEGEWIERENLIQRQDLPSDSFDLLNFRVAYVFQDDRVIHVSLQHTEKNLINDRCSGRALYFAGLIRAIYGTDYTSHRDIQWSFARDVLDVRSNIYFFVFSTGSFIRVTSNYYAKRSNCELTIHYRASRLSILPF